jgi:hypothetical protein
VCGEWVLVRISLPSYTRPTGFPTGAFRNAVSSISHSLQLLPLPRFTHWDAAGRWRPLR